MSKQLIGSLRIASDELHMHILPVHVSIAGGGKLFDRTIRDNIATTRGTYSIIIVFNIKKTLWKRGKEPRVEGVGSLGGSMFLELPTTCSL